ncbi:tRNA (adenosine(37)-N6)-threonylcarbamoyltransferase complex dimerization subunit type 1 TsaB [Aurantiacibacter suaedae]|uniref:tRNA (adenosine(37)-N6)-threonylcarbamoyltransferase complex dimerization subunit type 1 TsaB n=1 Tax=Aurantiacibacter suaedae TaxID=2545755 RepID=UPI0010F914C4|nr:tRNA (adenosine(37)-N6)-threonylcarbamoyltransferase complex dimerization subunit type 1 TsaB [Aurantiacibacter suaedae]
MTTLAIDCATEACSVALFNGGELVDGRFAAIGRGHAERLVPMIAELPGKGRAERIVVSLGPGSFTGIRIGLAAARALGLAWGAEVLGYPTLTLVAAMARADHPDTPITVCMNGGHGEWFVQNFTDGGEPEDDIRSLAPPAAALAGRHPFIAGNRACALAEQRGDDRHALELLPDARAAHLLGPAQLTATLAPIYGRAPDARLPQAKV